MTYEVHFKLGDVEYTVRGPDTTGILALIDGLEPKRYVPPQRLRETVAQLMAQETPLPEIDPAEEGWITMIGSNRPVRAHAKVMVRNRDTGGTYGPYPAHTVVWENVSAYFVIHP